MATVWFTSVLN